MDKLTRLAPVARALVPDVRPAIARFTDASSMTVRALSDSTSSRDQEGLASSDVALMGVAPKLPKPITVTSSSQGVGVAAAMRGDVRVAARNPVEAQAKLGTVHDVHGKALSMAHVKFIDYSEARKLDGMFYSTLPRALTPEVLQKVIPEGSKRPVLMTANGLPLSLRLPGLEAGISKYSSAVVPNPAVPGTTLVKLGAVQGSVQFQEGGEIAAVMGTMLPEGNPLIEGVPVKDFPKMHWTKIAGNTALNGMATLCRCNLGELAALMEKHPELEDVFNALMAEVVKLAGSQGVALDEAEVRASTIKLMKDNAIHLTSTRGEVDSGGPVDVDGYWEGTTDRAQSLSKDGKAPFSTPANQQLATMFADLVKERDTLMGAGIKGAELDQRLKVFSDKQFEAMKAFGRELS